MPQKHAAVVAALQSRVPAPPPANGKKIA